MLRVQITDEHRKEALITEKKILANLPKSDNYEDMGNKRRYLYGAIGEIGFREALDKMGKKYIHHNNTDGLADQGDFTIFLPNYELKVDVKCSSDPRTKYCRESIARIEKHGGNYLYVGTRIKDGYIEVWGYADKNDMREVKSVVPSIGIEFERMTPIEQLIGKMQDD